MKLFDLIWLFVCLILGKAAGITRLDNDTLNACEDCKSTLAYLQTIAFIGDEALVKMLQQTCGGPLNDDEDFCLGIIALQGPVLADTLRKIEPSSRAAVLLCNALMGACEYPHVMPYNLSFPLNGQCHVPLASKVSPMAEVASMMEKRAPLRIAHFSDIHVDLLYATGSNANCSKPMCCRNYTLADEPGHNDAPAGPFGEHNCGSPPSLEESMYQAIQELSPDFSIFTGDIVDHAIWNTSTGRNEMEIRSTYSAMKKAGMGRVYSTLGNHEMSPANALPHCDWLQWLIEELDSAERDGERVYIIGHMPMGGSDAFHDASNYFDQVINRYQSTIAAMFFGHTHLDQFEISYSDYQAQTAENAVSISYIAPSMAPLSGMPAFRIYTVDPITFGILDVETYSADMDEEGFNVRPVWTRSFSAREEYGSSVDPPLDHSPKSELTPSFWHNVTTFLESNATAFDAYWARPSSGKKSR
ncbi:hypothetical protein TrVFT333_002203 [Trichoderma virens FT-333]|nr:hypothetical protein TrVFT333_002203 [Trichoderma virens FT-333]